MSFEKFFCTRTNAKKHFLQDPVFISSIHSYKCSHGVCRKCIPKDSCQLKCDLCDVATASDCKNIGITAIEWTESFNSESEKFFEFLEKESVEELNRLKNLNEIRNETIEVKLKYIEEEIEIRIESLKQQLEVLFEKFKANLEKIRSDLLYKERDTTEFEDELQQLRANIQNKTNLNEKNFFSFDDKLLDLRQYVQEVENTKYELSVDISTKTIPETFIGSICSSYVSPQLKNKLKVGDYEVIKLDFTPYTICPLPNNQLACASLYEKSINILDAKFNTLKKLTGFDADENFIPYGLACNGEDRVYICNQVKHEIIMTDLEFSRKIKVFASSQGSKHNQLDMPYDIHYKNSLLYIPDFSNKRIQVLDDDLNFMTTIELQCTPWKVRASNDTLCINSYFQANYATSNTYFYSLKNFQQIERYPNGQNRTSELNSAFYEFNGPLMKLYCYDSNGKTVNVIDMKRFKQHTHAQNHTNEGMLVNFDNTLLMAMGDAKKFIKFK